MRITLASGVFLGLAFVYIVFKVTAVDGASTTTTMSMPLLCPSDTYRDELKKVCRNLTCVFPMDFVDDECQNLQKDVSNTTFEVFLKMVYQGTRQISEMSVFHLDLLVFWDGFLEYLLPVYLYEISHIDIYMPHLILDSDVLNRYDYIVSKLSIVIPPSSQESTQFIEYIMDLHQVNTHMEVNGDLIQDVEGLYEMVPFWIEIVQLERLQQEFGDNIMVNAVNGDTLISMENNSSFMLYPDLPTTMLLPTTACTLVTLHHDEFEFQSFNWGLRIAEIDANISRWDFLENIVEDQLVSVMLCVDQYHQFATLDGSGWGRTIEVFPFLISSVSPESSSLSPSVSPESSSLSSSVSPESSSLSSSVSPEISSISSSVGPESPSISSSVSPEIPSLISTIDPTRDTTIDLNDHFKFNKMALSIVCVTLSEIACLLTVIERILATKLRSQINKSNVVFCINLILAQLFFETGRDWSKDLTKAACETIGILAHFFWLETIMWTTVCSVQSFRLSRRKGGHRNADRHWKVTLAMSLLFTTTVTALALGINVKFARGEHGGMGYGGKHSCFISEKIMLWITLVLPIAIVVPFNIALFIISRVSKNTGIVSQDSAGMKEPYFLFTYFIMSVLLGCLWMCGVSYLQSDEEWLDYIFIILNASPGCFLVASFVDFKKYSNKLGLPSMRSKFKNRTDSIDITVQPVELNSKNA